MNKFKFRGRHLSLPIWIVGDGVEYLEPREYGEEPRAFILRYGFRTEVDPDTVSQTTGKRDVNGIEIFEGDVVRDNVIIGNRWETPELC